MEAWALHASTDRRGRLLAPPLLIYRSVTIRRDNRTRFKGHVEFCGAAIIERLEHVVQRDPETGRSFPNLVLDLAVVDLAATGDTLDMQWIDDRRDPRLDAEQAAPARAGVLAALGQGGPGRDSSRPTTRVVLASAVAERPTPG